MQTQENPIPRREAAIELETVGFDWWSYRWLNLPQNYPDGPGGPGGRYGHRWDAQDVNDASLEYKRIRPRNYATNIDNIPGYFYQPEPTRELH